MTVRPSDVARTRDDSFVGTLRRVGVWLNLLIGLWLVPMLAVQIGAVVEGRGVAPFGLRKLVHALGRLATHDLRETGRSWWQELPHPGHSPHGVVAILVGLVVATALVLAVSIALWSRLLRSTGLAAADRRQRRQLDGASWAERDELAPLLVDPARRRGRIVLGAPREPKVRGDRLVAAEAGHAVLVVAPPDRGTTASVVVPAVLDWEGPVLVVSPTRDVFDATAGHRATGGEARVLDPTGETDPERVRTVAWTPLGEARSWPAARTIADQLTGAGRDGTDDDVAHAAGELLAGLLFAAAHCTVPSMLTVVQWLADPEHTGEAVPRLLHGMVEDRALPDAVRGNAPHAARAVQEWTAGAAARSTDPVRAAASRAVRAWADHRFCAARPDDPGTLDPEWLWSPPRPWEVPGDRRTLYVLAPERASDPGSALVVGVVAQIHRAYARAGREGRLPDGRLLVVLEDVARTAPVPALDVWVTAARGLGISLLLSTPDLTRLDVVWGRDKAGTIAAGPRVRMFGPGLADGRTLAHVERLAGEAGVAFDRESRSPWLLGFPTSRQTQTQWRPLVSQQALRELQDGSGLVLSGTVPPFTVAWRSAATDRDLASRTGLPPLSPGEEELRHLRTPRMQRSLLVPPGLGGRVGALRGTGVVPRWVTRRDDEEPEEEIELEPPGDPR